MKKLLIFMLVLLLMGVGWMFFSNKNLKPTVKETLPYEEAPIIKNPAMNDGITPKEKVLESENSIMADLADVSGGNASGTGYILREGNILYHHVVASLPKPQGDNEYEGWLVKKEPTLMFFSTGLMKMSEDGDYELSYTGEEESLGYDFVVITEETIVDEIPETHILEGEAL